MAKEVKEKLETMGEIIGFIFMLGCFGLATWVIIHNQGQVISEIKNLLSF